MALYSKREPPPSLAVRLDMLRSILRHGTQPPDTDARFNPNGAPGSLVCPLSMTHGLLKPPGSKVPSSPLKPSPAVLALMLEAGADVHGRRAADANGARYTPLLDLQSRTHTFKSKVQRAGKAVSWDTEPLLGTLESAKLYVGAGGADLNWDGGARHLTLSQGPWLRCSAPCG